MAGINKMNLVCISDGFGDSRACPDWYPDFIKWPTLIGLMSQGVNVVNLSRYGAGNEYIANCLLDYVKNNPVDYVLAQWTIPNRLDLMLAHEPAELEYWRQVRVQDSVYRNNTVTLNSQDWWLTSGSQAADDYHKKYISLQQHQSRSQMLIDYVRLWLNERGTSAEFMLSLCQEYQLDTQQWIWHRAWQGMHEFRFSSKYAELDLGLTQPMSLIQFDFIKQFIMPRLNLNWRSEQELSAVEAMLYRKYKVAKENKPT